MAGSSLFFGSCWLGTFELTAKSKPACIRPIADEPNRALSTGKSPRLAASDSSRFKRGTFRCAAKGVRGAGNRWRPFLQRTRASNWSAAVTSRRRIVSARRARFCHVGQFRRIASASRSLKQTPHVWPEHWKTSAQNESRSHRVRRTLVGLEDSELHE